MVAQLGNDPSIEQQHHIAPAQTIGFGQLAEQPAASQHTQPAAAHPSAMAPPPGIGRDRSPSVQSWQCPADMGMEELSQDSLTYSPEKPKDGATEGRSRADSAPAGAGGSRRSSAMRTTVRG